MLKFIENQEHYTEVIEKSLRVKRSLWVGTADIKDLYIKSATGGAKPYLSGLEMLIRQRVEVRLLFAKEPGQNFKNDFDKYSLLIKYLETAICPRVHFKIFVFDFEEVYIGSANLTGAGLGMKSEHTRNFEAGILTNHPQMLHRAIELFDSVWNGSQCPKCQRKSFCPLPINMIT